MNRFDEPVIKAETDAEILNALQGVKLMQSQLQEIVRSGDAGASMAMAFLRAYYEKLPDSVARRLTEIDRGAVDKITSATAFGLHGDTLERFAARIAGDAAFAQVIRATNAYREKMGYAPLGADGWPEKV